MRPGIGLHTKTLTMPYSPSRPEFPTESSPQVSPPYPHPVLVPNLSSAHHGKGHPHPATPGRHPQLGSVNGRQAPETRSHPPAPGQSSIACGKWKKARQSKWERAGSLSKVTVWDQAQFFPYKAGLDPDAWRRARMETARVTIKGRQEPHLPLTGIVGDGIFCLG